MTFWKADKCLNPSLAQTWTKGSTAVSLQVPAFGAGEKKQYMEGTEEWKRLPTKQCFVCTAKHFLHNIPLHKRVNKDSPDFPFSLGKVPALSSNLIIHHSPQGKQSGPWKENEQKNEKLPVGQPKDNLWAISHRTSPAHRCCTNSITLKSALV